MGIAPRPDRRPARRGASAVEDLPFKAGQSLTYADVAMDESLTAVKLRREMEQAFAPAASKIAAQ